MSVSTRQQLVASGSGCASLFVQYRAQWNVVKNINVLLLTACAGCAGHPSALLPWRSCRTLMGWPPTVRWCLPASAPELTVDMPLRVEAAADAQQAASSMSALPAGRGAAAAAAATASAQGAARSSTGRRIGELAPPALCVYRHGAGPGAPPGMPIRPLTAKQVGRYYLRSGRRKIA